MQGTAWTGWSALLDFSKADLCALSAQIGFSFGLSLPIPKVRDNLRLTLPTSQAQYCRMVAVDRQPREGLAQWPLAFLPRQFASVEIKDRAEDRNCFLLPAFYGED